MLNLEPNMLVDQVRIRLAQLRQEADVERRLRVARNAIESERRGGSPLQRMIARLRLGTPRPPRPARARPAPSRRTGRRSDVTRSSAGPGLPANAGGPPRPG